MLTIFLNGKLKKIENRIFVSKSGKPYTVFEIENTPFRLLAPPNIEKNLSFSAKVLEPNKLWLIQTFEQPVKEPFFIFGTAEVILPRENSFLTGEGIKVVGNIPSNIENFKTCFIAGYFDAEEEVIKAETVKGIVSD